MRGQDKGTPTACDFSVSSQNKLGNTEVASSHHAFKIHTVSSISQFVNHINKYQLFLLYVVFLFVDIEMNISDSNDKLFPLCRIRRIEIIIIIMNDHKSITAVNLMGLLLIA